MLVGEAFCIVVSVITTECTYLVYTERRKKTNCRKRWKESEEKDLLTKHRSIIIVSSYIIVIE